MSDPAISSFVISLDFELFWGVCGTQTVDSYGRHVEGEWEAVPRMLKLFRRYGMRVTWATVGMAMCRGYKQWRGLRPAVLPGYQRMDISTYAQDALVREYPRLFFARPLVERILDTPGQELASHTYSHFYCAEPGATPEQFAADLACYDEVAADVGVSSRGQARCSLVFPRNQIVERFIAVLPKAGIRIYRGNADHWLYRNGDAVAGGKAGRAVRYADACLPISGKHIAEPLHDKGIVNLPASMFLYPTSGAFSALAAMRISRVKRAMTAAARRGGVFHLWWHPHNFGINTDANMAMLESILRHYRVLADRYGMRTGCMNDFAAPVGPAQDDPAQDDSAKDDPFRTDEMNRRPQYPAQASCQG